MSQNNEPRFDGIKKIKFATNVKRRFDFESEDEWEKYVCGGYRTSHLMTCEICGKLYGDHGASPLVEHQTDDGTGRKVPYLHVDCEGQFMKF